MNIRILPGCTFLSFLLIGALLSICHAAQPRSADADGITAQAHMDAGSRYFRHGRFSDGLEQWSLAERFFNDAGDMVGQSSALLHKGSAYLALGKYTDAVASLQRARTLTAESDARELLAAITGTLGYAYMLLGRSDEGQRLLEAAISMAMDTGAKDIAARAQNNLGNLHAAAGRYSDASEAFRASLASADDSGEETLAAKTSVNLARALLAAGKADEVAPALAAAKRRTSKLPSSHDKAYAQISLGRLYQQWGAQRGADPADDLRAATAIFQGAIQTAKSAGDQRSLSYGLGYLGRLQEQQERYREALGATQGAVQAAQAVGALESLYLWEWQTGRLLRVLGDEAGAVAAYQRAIYSLQSIRSDLNPESRDGRGSFRQSFGPIYMEYSDLLLETSETLTDPIQVEGYLREVRTTMETLKGAELEDYFQDDCVTALREKTRGIDRLASRTAALYPIILEDRLELLLSLPQGMERFVTRVDADSLLREIRGFRQRLEKRTTHQYMPHGKQLYEWVIRPLEPALKRNGIDTLVIVPDGALRTIPMAALHDGREFLIGRYAIATTPGLTLTDPRPLGRGQTKVLLGGLTEAVQGFPPLPNVEQELQRVHGLYGGTLLQNREFVIPNMESELTRTPYSIVHVASHGRFDGDVNNTFLLTYDGKLSMDALEQYLGISKYRSEPVELLTLSACQTAAGDDRAALGLAGIAIKAGARSALATLWFISDQASAQLVAEFYQELQNPALSKAKALQRAQLSLLQDRRYRHPAYWSPFLLIGNWL